MTSEEFRTNPMFLRNQFRVMNIIRTRFLQVDFRQLIVKILANPYRICCVFALICQKSNTVKNLRPEIQRFLLDFW